MMVRCQFAGEPPTWGELLPEGARVPVAETASAPFPSYRDAGAASRVVHEQAAARADEIMRLLLGPLFDAYRRRK